MSKYLVIISLIMFFTQNISARECLIIKDFNSNKIIKQEGEVCEQRFFPCSTFKLPISLMGFDSDILIDEHNPEWKYDGSQKDRQLAAAIPNMYDPKDPMSWMQISAVWYSQIITEKLGPEKFQKYLKQFNYGNQRVLDNEVEGPGLYTSWLTNGSLRISPTEQMKFLENFLNKKLGVSDHAYKMTHNIAHFKDLDSGEKIYGKSGSCNVVNKNGSKDINKFAGWFIGWTEKDDKVQKVFVKFIKDEKDVDPNDFVGLRAKKIIVDELSKLSEK
jgi:beta-lactamase class D